MFNKLFPFLALMCFSSILFSQKTVQFRVSTVYSDVDDMDGFGSGASDPQWDYEIFDLANGLSDNGSTELGGTNCPYWNTLNDQFFSQSYDCVLPTAFNFEWSGFEDDAIGSDANTGNQTVVVSGLNPNQSAWTNAIVIETATAGGDNCSGGGTVTWRIQLQYRITGSSLCLDECTDPYVIPTAAQFDCGPTQTTTLLSTHIYAREPGEATDFSYSTAGITCTIDGSSPEDIWIRTTIPDSTGGVNISFENHGECTGLLCQTNITYAWYTSSDGTCAGLEYRGCDAVSCFLGCSDGSIQVDGLAGEDVWVRIWEEDDQGHHIEINSITPTAPADKCYTALPLSGFGCNYEATSPSSGAYAEPDLASWTSAAHPGGACQDGDMNPATNTIWSSNENMVWYTYTHAGGDFDLAVDNMSCSGGAATAQIGVFSNSGTATDPSCDLSSEAGYGCSVGEGAVQLSIASMPVGNYIIVVDGNAGAECDWIFTDFIGGDPLPIELFKFEATLINREKVQLNWLTASEINNDFFTIERSSDATIWEEIGIVNGAGNSTVILQYQEFDLRPHYGLSYYRLKQSDFNGESTYSSVRLINNKTLSDIILYPNPATVRLTVEFDGDLETEFFVTNSIGQQVQTSIIISGDKAYVDISDFPEGMYMLTVYRDGMVQHEKFVKKHSY